MLFDKLETFCLATSVAAAAGTAKIGNALDLWGGTTKILGEQPLYVAIRTTTQIITGGSAGTVQFFVVTDAADTLASAVLANCTEHMRSISIVTDDATAINDGIALGTAANLPNQVGGLILAGQLPVGTYERYLGILCTTATTTTTAGAISAILTRDYQSWQAFANGV
jgi:hypothetical protein